MRTSTSDHSLSCPPSLSCLVAPDFHGLVAVLVFCGFVVSTDAAEMKLVGPSGGVASTKLGTTTHRTKYLLEGGFDGVKSGLGESDFFKAIAGREKKIDTVLLVREVSSKRIIKSILKQSKRVRKDHKESFTKVDTKNIEEFLESAQFAKEYPRGTRFVVESGKGKRKPAYVVFSSGGQQVSRSEVTDTEQIKSVRKFMALQKHWHKHYEG
ncbi:MAG: hypothetical protein VYA62_05905 [Planctomycetota bacterium]|nr:hypothetical protein [Planctomycetota bacterium]